MRRKGLGATPRAVTAVIGAVVLLFAFNVLSGAYAQSRKGKQQPPKETYTRPKPTQPVKPEIPEANRYQEDKVFLENADSLFRPANQFEEYQVVKGEVKFRHGGVLMFCDSAYYYPDKNSLDAYGHVEMRQGDTLFVYGDKLYYDGFSKHATLTRGPSRNEVELKNRNVRLVTDSLDYDLNTDLGWYTLGGTLSDDVNTLTSVYGEYSPSTKQAKFRDNVVLVNNKDGYRMLTEELDYNTSTHIANINTQTRIEGANDTILTTRGWYDTRTDHAQLTARSTIIHRDSSMNVTTLEGDSIIYDKQTRTSRAYMFRNPFVQRKPMVLTDTARKMTLIGGYGEYNDGTRTAFSTDYPLLIEYSRPDSLFLRADTIWTSVRTMMVWPDSLSREIDSDARTLFKSMGSLDAIAATMPLSLQLRPYGMKSPADFEAEARKAREDAEKARLTQAEAAAASQNNGNPESQEGDSDGLEFISANQRWVATEPEKEPGEVPEPESPTGDGTASLSDMAVPEDAAIAPKPELTAAQRDSIARIPGIRIDKFGRDSAYMVPKDFHVAKAWRRARLFNKDIQGVADTLRFEEYDSVLYMIKKPGVWSGERQIYGNLINVHFNDSTVDRAHLPESGVAAEHIDEDFYNQLSGSEMKAWFVDGKLSHLDVSGNVETIMLPQEKDSSYNKMVTAESSYLSIDVDNNELKHLKMWPEVTGSVTPLFDVKQSQKYIRGFRWLDALRPKRQWYGDRVKWEDELGEVPEELDAYFNEAPIVRPAPKSPFGQNAQGRPGAVSSAPAMPAASDTM